MSLKDQNSGDPRFFRRLSLLKNLKYLNLDLQKINHSLNLETLQRFLQITHKRQSWPKFQILRLSLYYPVPLRSNIDQTLWTLSQSLRNLGQIITLMPTKLELDVPLKIDCNIETAAHFSEALKSVSQLTRLELSGKSYNFFTSVLGELNQYQNLQELFLYFFLGDQPEAEGKLIQILQKSMKECKSLRRLEMSLWFRDHSNKAPTDTQFQPDGILINLSNSLSSLRTLEHLTLNISLPTNEKIQAGTSKMLSCINSLRSLKILELDLSRFGDNITDEELNTLCASLRNFENLYHLSMNFSSQQIKDLGIKSLEQTLPLLKNLGYFALSLNNCEGISSFAVAKLISKLNQLKYLSFLTLCLKELRIDTIFTQALMKTIPQLKFLTFFRLINTGTQKSKKVLDDLKEWIQLFKTRMIGDIQESYFDLML